MKSILIPLDGSLIAEQVLPYARRLANALGAGVKLLTVVDDGDDPPPMREELVAGMTRGVVNVAYSENVTPASLVQRKQAHAYLANQAQHYFSGLDVDTIVHVGSPAEAIIDVAERHEVTMISMVSRGYSGLRRWALGSVSDKVVHGATVPIFIVRAVEDSDQQVPPFRRILVPLDGSPLARQALPLACDLAGQAQGELFLLTVAAHQPAGGSEFTPTPEQQASERGALSERLLEEAAPFSDILREHKVTVTPLVAPPGAVADRIIEAAEHNQTDLVVMATHGYGGLRRWALGSVADRVLHACPQPLLLVRARESTVAR